MRFVDAQTRDQPIPDVSVKVCALDDLACADAAEPVVSDADGRVSLELPLGPNGFGGFLELTGTAIPVTLLRLLPPLGFTEDVDGFRVVTLATLAAVSTALGVAMDPARGHLTVETRDCDGALASGVSYAVDTADGLSTRFYVAADRPSSAATATDVNGSGGVANVPAGSAVITATVAADGRVIGRLPVVVRAGAVSSSLLPPTPL